LDFSLPEEVLKLRATVKAFIEKTVDPRAREIEENDHVPEELISASKELGLFALSIPEEYGGLGLGMVGKAAVYEELGKTSNAFTTVIGCHTGIGSVGIVELANEEQKRRYLPKMARGELVGAFALTEPEAGTDAANVQTTAVRDGDRFILNGQKRYITNGPIADVVTVMASTDRDRGPKGITAFIVESSAPGFRVGEVDNKMGLRGSYTGELFFEDCEVPAENVLGEEGRGYVNALKVLANGRAGLPARNLGSCTKLLELSLAHAKTREQFGKPIFEQQVIQHYLAEMALEIEALRTTVYRVAWMVDQGASIIKEAAMAKLFGSEVYNRVADKAVQIHGGAGYMREHEIERYYRDGVSAQVRLAGGRRRRGRHRGHNHRRGQPGRVLVRLGRGSRG
jgi:acyl-CoA dehydrogenase